MSTVPTATRTLGRVRRRLGLTLGVSAGVFRRPKALAVFAAVTAAYLVTFLRAMADLVFRTGAGFGVAAVVDDPLSRMFVPGPGPYTHEPIALIELGIATFTFSPLNTALGLSLSVLVGLNLAITSLAVTQPASCGIGASSGVLASVPALLAGSTCCAPVILVAFGIQASGIFLTAFTWLLPLGVLALVGSVVYLAGQVDPAAV
jgi:hypothetical protein